MQVLKLVRAWTCGTLCLLFWNSAVASETSSSDLIAVSMVNLLTKPGVYEGKRVEVTGYLAGDGDLYLTRDHAAAFDSMSAFAISDTDQGDFSFSDCVGGFVRVRGAFVELDPGSYIIRAVEYLAQPGGVVCWSTEFARDGKTDKARSVVQKYISENKGWAQKDYEIHFKRFEPNAWVYWAVHAADRTDGRVGGGRSVEVHVDPREMRVVEELGFQ